MDLSGQDTRTRTSPKIRSSINSAGGWGTRKRLGYHGHAGSLRDSPLLARPEVRKHHPLWSLARQSASHPRMRSVLASRTLRLRITTPSRRRGSDREVSSGSRVPPPSPLPPQNPDPLPRPGPSRHDERVLPGWDSGVRFALCLYLCLLQEGTSSQNLAAVREERSLGCVLQSCCDWNQAARRCGNRLCCNGLLRLVYKMNSKVATSSTANQGDEGEEPLRGLDAE
ncbi:protein kish-B isoform X1 [Oryctolagus cuniculus]|uniref:protein kish-B isoform X1 n=1 Tax=Oryctolagus cuniculus TaxID=9986 RepID=UPI0038792075